jgi:hypothetical protein
MRSAASADNDPVIRGRDDLTNAADAAAAYFGLAAPVYICAGCERRPRFDGRCGCS